MEDYFKNVVIFDHPLIAHKLFTRQVPTGYQLYSAVDLPPILNIY